MLEMQTAARRFRFAQEEGVAFRPGDGADGTCVGELAAPACRRAAAYPIAYWSMQRLVICIGQES